MPFAAPERQRLLALKGVGETVILRLEQLGFSSLEALKSQDPAEITRSISRAMGSTCWHNSPQARAAIQNVLNLAEGQEVVLRR